jgi:hypothetical protein
MFKWISALLDRIFVVMGAFIFSQIPIFMQQYRMQLTGHVAELRLQVGLMQQVALSTGKTLEQFIQKFTQSSDADFAGQGEIMNGMVSRLQTLSDGLTALNTASVFTRPYEFLIHYQPDIGKATLEIFEMGIAFTYEGLVYALIGIIVGYFLYHIIRSLFSKVKRTFLKMM